METASTQSQKNLSQYDLFVKLILSRLEQVENSARNEFKKNQNEFGIGYCAIENLLPEDWAVKIFDNFNPSNQAWREMRSFRECKLTSKQFDQFNTILKDITFAVQDERVLKQVEKITQITNLIPDDKLYAGGLSMMRYQDFLDPHIDNSHEQTQSYYRRLNLLYYVTPNWKIENGGHLELWDKYVKHSRLIESGFNRLVLMETHKLSWHSVSPVALIDGYRCCVSNYYFSPDSPDRTNYFHVTSFMARPSQPIKRIVFRIDNILRRGLRYIKKNGFGRSDVYVKKE